MLLAVCCQAAGTSGEIASGPIAVRVQADISTAAEHNTAVTKNLYKVVDAIICRMLARLVSQNPRAGARFISFDELSRRTTTVTLVSIDQRAQTNK